MAAAEAAAEAAATNAVAEAAATNAAAAAAAATNAAAETAALRAELTEERRGRREAEVCQARLGSWQEGSLRVDADTTTRSRGLSVHHRA